MQRCNWRHSVTVRLRKCVLVCFPLAKRWQVHHEQQTSLHSSDSWLTLNSLKVVLDLFTLVIYIYICRRTAKYPHVLTVSRCRISLKVRQWSNVASALLYSAFCPSHRLWSGPGCPLDGDLCSSRPFTDGSRHAALWASAPAYREKKRGGRDRVGGTRSGEIDACQASNLREVSVFGAREISLFQEKCLISLFVCLCVHVYV